ncbi:MAG: DUF262 domain-containing protein [Oscillatoriales cyanobacterium]|jgi:hypothetical protein|uniref:DUF262 domain-containing protein n=1 Tax=unclassified Microcoleus TaxID=2642155 RepID=UPI001DFEE736|nr:MULTISPECIES: DUF262 domain-containing protein [unclassified Microcoleus]TAE67255.1 MAG: DUF262 domain-containing protein [Oscillatoriales cyanobacterium]MCC3434072.1 DUF262 domain-containing protein [Microcoleus sp. PH2017_05_CCC_O_A]MCC3446920.1 DUF262 domain-containing protein [Microcoleus sp. PH2017_09_SFU_O_A]MCC3583423.1 DUF262 domain-containing protein [Microcoleus sp. PH2017_30_WIL_O_A]MCC3592771.1 DUF262 domain-containing protein [Microcoleus sp. PH2017_28_MFU_U_A]
MVGQPELEQQVSNQDSMINDLNLSQEEDNGDELYETDKLIYDPDEINIFTREPTIEQLLRRINEEALDLAPDFQRHANIWKDDAKSRLIESILIRIPLPAFYIDATDEDKWLVVDGLQRLSALKQFMSDKTLKLCGLEYLLNLEDKTYDEIERRYQRRIEETQVTVYLIEKGTPPEVKYNIFKRINTGGLPMSPQELRHALNPGKATKFLAKLAISTEFQQVTKLSKLRKMRMDDREFILGFLAFTLTSYKDYQSEKRNLFLSKALSKINNMSEPELKVIENNFIKAMVAAWKIFGKNAFRKISQHQTKMFPINKALFEVWSVNLSLLSDEQLDILKQQKEQLIEKFRNYVDSDRDFLTSISQAAEKIEYRFMIIEQIIQEVLT